jgi:RNA polymerase sigma factor (sigma-70 family)
MNAVATLEPNDTAAEAAFARRRARVMEAVDLNHTVIVDYLRRLTRNSHDAEDIVQDLWAYVVVHFREEQIGNLSLLRRKAYQLFVDRYRAALRRRETITADLPEIALAAPRENHFSAVGEAELREKFWREFPGIDLTEPQKEALWQHARYGFTIAEVAARTGVAPSTVGDWIQLGRTRLGAYLAAQQNPQQKETLA